MDLIEHYNNLLRTTEDDIIRLLDRVLDASFNRLVRRARIQMKLGGGDRTMALLQEFRQLIPAYRPDRVDAYDRLFRRLAGQAQAHGLNVSDQLLQHSHPTRGRIHVSIPLDATVAAAAQSRGYLRRHGERFAETAATTVAQGIAEGRPTDAMVRDMRQRLNVVKSRAQTIVRTESLRAYNKASDTYYANNGIDLVLYYATSDDRTCDVCVPSAGEIYRRGTVTTPRHPRCRCYLAPWDEDISAMDPEYVKQRTRHRREVRKASVSPVSLNSAAIFQR